MNAKNHEGEGEIIASAGKRGAVTIATNMAGRGVDIVLGGEPPSRFSIDPNKDKKAAEAEYTKAKEEWQRRHDEIVELGGLYVISTERHESRRIDNQLRGRAGRQGDPGDTRFFVSLEDDMMRIFGGDQVSKVMTFFKMDEDQPIEHSMVSRALEQAQQKVEGFNFDTRKHLVDFDDVLNKQREILYKLRTSMLMSDEKNGAKIEGIVKEAFSEQLNQLLNTFMYAQETPDFEGLAKELDVVFPGSSADILKRLEGAIGDEEVREGLNTYFAKVYEDREKDAGKELWHNAVRYIYLDTIDTYWTEHLTAIDDLRSGINLRGYAQLDPLTEYKNEAFSMFESLLSNINFEVVRRIGQMRLNQETQKDIKLEERQSQKMVYSAASKVDVFKNEASEEQKSHPVVTVKKTSAKLGRNDPCWCGSGKKYKKCHYPD